MKSTLVIFDISSIIFRSYYSGSLSYNGKPTQLIFKSLRTINSLLKKFNATDYICAVDCPPYFRKQVFPQYKSNRPTVVSDFDAQKSALFQFLSAGTTLVGSTGYEADDIIAAASLAFQDDYERIIIVSSDSDLFQLLTDTTELYDLQTKKLRTIRTFRKEFDLLPSQWAMAKALSGDNSDTIPGIHGIQIKTAAKYINKQASTAVNQKVQQNLELIKQNLELITLPYTTPMLIQFNFEYHFNTSILTEFFTEFGFNSMLKSTDLILTHFNCIRS